MDKILNILTERLPSLGLRVNQSKTVIAHSDEVSSFPALRTVREVLFTVPGSGIKVLGVPIGDTAFIEAELALILAKVQHYCVKICRLDHPQAGLLLLRKCNGVCRVAHALKVLAPQVVDQFLQDVDATMMDAVQKLAGLPLSETGMTQVQLPVRMGGLGVPTATSLAPVARFVAAWNFLCRGREAVGFPDSEVVDGPPMPDLRTMVEQLPGTCLPPRVWLAEGRVPDEAEPEWPTQKWWGSKLQERQREDLLAKATGRDMVRLQCLNHPSAGTWLEAIPCAALGLEITPAVFRALLRFRLGTEVLPRSSEGEVRCLFCHDVCDPFGDHTLTCKKAEFHSRHYAIVDLLTRFIRAAKIKVENEITVGDRKRPADLLATTWTRGSPQVADVTVTHPMAPSLGLSLEAAKKAVERKAQRKNQTYSALVAAHRMEFTQWPCPPSGS